MMLTVFFVCVCVSALMCIVKPDGSPQLCKTDEIGEIVINSRAGGTMYYGLPGVTKNTFEVCQSLKDMYDNYMSHFDLLILFVILVPIVGVVYTLYILLTSFGRNST